jgi:hypothetical protein
MIYVYINSNTALPVGNLLFDNYPGTTGFSLRKLKTSYGGSCIRVRRSSDNAEQEIGFVNDELDVTALLLFCKGTSGFVKTWWDQSGNGAYITNSTAASQPRIVDNGVLDTFKGKPAVYFNNHQLDYTALPFLAHSNNFTAFATSVHTVINGAGAVLNGASGDNKRFALFANNNTNDVSWLIQSDLSGEVFMYQNRKKHKELRTTTAVVTSSKNMSTYDNDITKNTASYAGTYTNDTFRVGKQFLGLTALTGYISEIVLYNSDQSSSYPAIEKDTNRNYLIHYPKDAAVILDLYEVPGYPYTGPLIRVRRSSDNVEADFFEGATPGTLNTTRYGGGTELAAWVGGGNNGFVVTWYDQSGNARNYTQASGIYQPRIVTNGVIETVNGKPAVYSGGGLNRLEGPDISFSQSTIVSTYRLDNHTAPYDVCTIWNRTNSSNFIWNSHLFATTNGNVYLGDANSFSFPSALVAFNSKLKQTIAFGTRDNTKLKVSANNNPEDDDNILAASGLNNTSIFNSYVASSWGYYPLQGHIQNVILWTSDKSADKDIIQEVTNNYYKAYTDELLLDEYGTGCVAAYSLQKLKTGVTNCIRVRKDGPNTEQDVNFYDERMDQKSLIDFIGGGNNGEVVTWYDQSGNSINVTQATTTKQPQIVASGGSIQTDGSQPALYFNKANADVLISSTLPSTSKVYSVFAVIKFDNVSAQYSPIVCNGDSTSSGWGIYTEPGLNYVAFSGGIGGQNIGAVPSGTHLLTVLRLSDSDLKSFFNLACKYSGSANTMTTPSGSFYVGGGNFSEFFGGHILELIVYDTDKTTDRYSIEQNIKKRYINI